jgi:hypothetical protein
MRNREREKETRGRRKRKAREEEKIFALTLHINFDIFYPPTPRTPFNFSSLTPFCPPHPLFPLTLSS